MFNLQQLPTCTAASRHPVAGALMQPYQSACSKPVSACTTPPLLSKLETGNPERLLNSCCGVSHAAQLKLRSRPGSAATFQPYAAGAGCPLLTRHGPKSLLKQHLCGRSSSAAAGQPAASMATSRRAAPAHFVQPCILSLSKSMTIRRMSWRCSSLGRNLSGSLSCCSADETCSLASKH